MKEKEYKLTLFKDKKDYEITLTEDEVINVIGLKGSGKTTMSDKYINDNDYIVVNCDKLLEIGDFKIDEVNDKTLFEINNAIKEKYGTLDNEINLFDYYNVIINYCLNKGKKVFIEGNFIENINMIDCYKGKVIVKRTSVLKCFLRSIKRDYKNNYFMEQEKLIHKRIYKLTRLYKIIKRRTKIFNQRRDIERVIKKFEEKR